LTQPHQIEEFFRDSHKHVKAKNNNSGWLFGEVLGDCVGLLSLHEWRDLRKYVEVPFSRPSSQRYSIDIQRQAVEFLKALNIGDEGCIDPARDLQFYPFLVVANILFGTLSAQQRKDLLELAPLREELFKEVIRGGINRLQISKYIPWSGHGLLLKFQKKWLAFVESAYRKALAEAPTAPIVTLWQGVEAGGVSERQV
jgi:cytochrome P450